MANSKKTKNNTMHAVADEKDSDSSVPKEHGALIEMKAVMNELKYRINRNRLKII